MEDLLSNPHYKDFHYSFAQGDQVIFEGDHSEDLFVLISGALEIHKGDQKIAELTEPGSVFGEMAMLLEGQRTASLSASMDSQVLRIPNEKIAPFLHEHPDIAKKITHLLAQRLNEATNVIYGFKEFCDLIPDAVILTDKDGLVLSWNKAAENLYGITWNKMSFQPISTIFDDQEVMNKLFQECRLNDVINEHIVRINHPIKEEAYISLSSKCLYDANSNFHGFIFIGRDASKQMISEKRFKRVKTLFLPIFLLLLLTVGALLVTYPFLSHEIAVSEEKKGFTNVISENYRAISSILSSVNQAQPELTADLLANYLNQDTQLRSLYEGVLLLDDTKKVVFAFSALQKSLDTSLIGNNYAEVDFKGKNGSDHKILTLYRVSSNHPSGRKSTELAMPFSTDQLPDGWVVFQLNMPFIAETYELNENDLLKIVLKSKK